MGVDYPSYLESSANSPPPNIELAAAKLEKSPPNLELTELAATKIEKATIVINVTRNFIAWSASEHQRLKAVLSNFVPVVQELFDEQVEHADEEFDRYRQMPFVIAI